MKPALVRLELLPTYEQLASIEHQVELFKDWCEWLDENAPQGMCRFKDLYDWAYHKIRERGIYSQFIGRIIGKVSSKRTMGTEINCRSILYDQRMFTFIDSKLSMRLGGKKQIVDYKLACSENMAQMVGSTVVKSGLLTIGDNSRTFFTLRCLQPEEFKYKGKRPKK